jgi:hypothetical protein
MQKMLQLLLALVESYKRTFMQSFSVQHSDKAHNWVVACTGIDAAYVLPRWFEA